MKYALGGILIAIVLLTIGIGYTMRANAQESLECTYYFDDEDGNGNSAPTSCDSSGLPVPPSNPPGTVTLCAVSREARNASSPVEVIPEPGVAYLMVAPHPHRRHHPHRRRHLHHHPSAATTPSATATTAAATHCYANSHSNPNTYAQRRCYPNAAPHSSPYTNLNSTAQANCHSPSYVYTHSDTMPTATPTPMPTPTPTLCRHPL